MGLDRNLAINLPGVSDTFEVVAWNSGQMEPQSVLRFSSHILCTDDLVKSLEEELADCSIPEHFPEAKQKQIMDLENKILHCIEISDRQFGQN